MTPRDAKLPTILALLIAALIWTPGAGASSISQNGDAVTYTASPGEANSVLVTTSPYDTTCLQVPAPCLTVSDQQRITQVGPGCAVVYSGFAGDTAACPVPNRVVANLGDRNDAYWDWQGPSTVHGGDGSDNPIQGGLGDDQLYGDGGGDQLLGDDGDDTLDGGAGDDYLDGIPGGYPDESTTHGRDTYIGGGGGDSVTYEKRTEDLNLSDDGVANDGAAGEGDNIAPDVTAIYAGQGQDRLTGNGYRNALFGGPGDDELTGNEGDDHLVGNSGNDRVSGDAGQDLVAGDSGNDVIIGGPDVDRFYGDEVSACIAVTCPSGEDRIFARDGNAEAIDCGPGTDAVESDTIDQIYDSAYRSDQCESVDPAGPPAGGGAGPGGGGQATPGQPAGFQVIGAARVRKGAIVLRVKAPGAGKVSLRASAKRLRVGSASRKVTGPGEVTLTLKPSAAAKRALRAKGKLKVALTTTFTPADGGAAAKLASKVTLRKGR